MRYERLMFIFQRMLAMTLSRHQYLPDDAAAIALMRRYAIHDAADAIERRHYFTLPLAIFTQMPPLRCLLLHADYFAALRRDFRCRAIAVIFASMPDTLRCCYDCHCHMLRLR